MWAQRALGVNLPLAQLAAEPKLTGKDTNFIFVFLKGGMSTIDTFDLKPNAPEDVRGPFGSIPTNLPGMRVGEHLKNGEGDRFSQVRSFTHCNAATGGRITTCSLAFIPPADSMAASSQTISIPRWAR